MDQPSHSRPSGTWAALGAGCLMGLILGIFIGAVLQLYFPGMMNWVMTP